MITSEDFLGSKLQVERISVATGYAMMNNVIISLQIQWVSLCGLYRVFITTYSSVPGSGVAYSGCPFSSAAGLSLGAEMGQSLLILVERQLSSHTQQ